MIFTAGQMLKKSQYTWIKMLGAALATLNLVCDIASSKTCRTTQLLELSRPWQLYRVRYVLNVVELWHVNPFGLEQDATTVVIFYFPTSCNEWSVYHLQPREQHYNANSVAYWYIWFRGIWCLVQIVVNSVKLAATTWYQGRSPKDVYELAPFSY